MLYLFSFCKKVNISLTTTNKPIKMFVRTKTECLPSLEYNHKIFVTCYEDFSYYDIWLYVFISLFSILTMLIGLSISVREWDIKIFIQILLFLQSVLCIIYFIVIQNGLDTTDSFINIRLSYVFPGRCMHVLCMLSWLLMTIVLRDILDNITSFRIRKIQIRSKKIIFIGIIFAIITITLASISGITYDYDDRKMFNLSYLINNIITLGVIFGIIILACVYIIKLKRISAANHIINELFVVICFIILIGLLLIIDVIVYQLSMVMGFWNQNFAITYISVIYASYFVHLIISMYIIHSEWKKVIRKILCIKTKIMPNLQQSKR